MSWSRATLALSVAVTLAACLPAPTPGPSAAPTVAGPSLGATESPGPSPTGTPVAVVPPDLPILALRRTSFGGSIAVLVTGGRGPGELLGPVFTATWGLDGERIHLVTRDSACVPAIQTVATSREGERILGEVRSGFKPVDRAFAWSPDDSRVAFQRYSHGDPGECGSQGGVYAPEELLTDLILMRDDGSDRRVLLARALVSQAVAWSPDGTAIAVLENVPPLNENHQRLIVLSPGDGHVRTVLAERDAATIAVPMWSPDGRRIAFQFYTDDWHLGLVGADGTGFRDLGRIGSNGSNAPLWSPDGRSIALELELDLGGTIVLYPADGGAPQPLALNDVETFNGAASWSPDSRWLLYGRETAPGAGGDGGLVMVTIDGTQRIELPDTEELSPIGWPT